MSTSRNDEVDLLAQLWRECAGPTAKVPRVDDKVFYFPQGHLHQVEAYMKQEGMSNNVPSYGLPSKILCKVVRVDLKAEVGTDEVFAEITLLPNCSEGEGPKLTSVVSEKKHATFFRKRLTPSDVIKQGGCSLHKRHVDQTFPPLDMKQDAPYQDLIAKDLHGQIWKFRHICRGLPKRHILTTGWSKFVSEKRLLPNDICIFLRGKNQLYVGVQRAVRGYKLPTELSTNNMKHGILLTAFEAFKTRTEFTVYYHPRISPSGFVVTYDDFMESLEANFSPKSRVEMVLDGGGGEEPELNLKKFSGFITGKEDVDPTMWPHSEWQSLKVCWDATSLGDVLPKRVSPWSIRSLESPLPHQQSLSQKLTLPKVHFLKNENKKCTLFGVEIGYTNTNSSNQQSNVTAPNYIKVLKHGGILGRFIDVTRVSGYKGLVSELDDMFDFQGMLANGNTQWHVTYEALGDCNKKILGNLPWLEFRKVVRKMYICQKQEVPKWNHS